MWVRHDAVGTRAQPEVFPPGVPRKKGAERLFFSCVTPRERNARKSRLRKRGKERREQGSLAEVEPKARPSATKRKRSISVLNRSRFCHRFLKRFVFFVYYHNVRNKFLRLRFFKIQQSKKTGENYSDGVHVKKVILRGNR